MSVITARTALTLGLGILLSAAAQAQSMSIGEFEYRNSCVQCHGESGKGDGPVKDFLSGAVPTDLTRLATANGGVFPIERMFSVIEGSESATVHGTRDMPVWGSRYLQRTMQPQADISGFSLDESRLYARTRILALIEYLSTIQAD